MNSSRTISQEWEKGYKGREIKASEWELQRDNFTRLYSTNNHDLNKVRKIMAEEYGFYANQRQYKTAIRRWSIRKNINKTKTLSILRIQDERELVGKKTSFNFNGQPVTEQKLERARKRHRGTGELPEWEQLSSPIYVSATPSDVTYWTPKPTVTLSNAGSESGWDTPHPNIFYIESPKSSPPGEKGIHIATQNESDGMQEFPAWAPWLGSPEPSKPEIPESPGTPESPLSVLCSECAIGGFTSHGVLSAESILYEAFKDKEPNSECQMSSVLSPSCTSGFYTAPFRVNYTGARYFSTSLFLEQRSGNLVCQMRGLFPSSKLVPRSL